MIHIDHKDFEKISGPSLKAFLGTIKGLLSPTEKAVTKDRIGTYSRSEAQKGISDDRKMKKHAKLQPMPKVDKSGLARAKKTTLDDSESHSMRRAIERSKNPKRVLTEVRKSTEPIYAGGNTAANMRGVMRAEEKTFRKKMKKRFGKHSRVKKRSFY